MGYKGLKGLAHRFATALAVLRTRARSGLGLSALIACAACSAGEGTDPQTGEQAGISGHVASFRDGGTGCEYLVYAPRGGITPRIGPDGKQICRRTERRGE